MNSNSDAPDVDVLETLPHAALLFRVESDAAPPRLICCNSAARAAIGADISPGSEPSGALARFWATAEPIIDAALAGRTPHPRVFEDREIRARRHGDRLTVTLTECVGQDLRAALDALPLALVVEDAARRIVYYNPAFARRREADMQHLRIGATMENLARECATLGIVSLDADTPESWAHSFMSAQRSGEETRLEKDGDDVTLRRTERLPGGGAIGWSTEIPRALAASSVERWISRQRAFVARLALVVGWRFEMSKGVFDLDESAQLIPGFEGRAHLTREEIRAIQRPEDVAETLLAFQRCIEKGERLDLERKVTLKGRQRWIRMLAERETRDGAVVGLVGVLQDITEQKQRELSLAGLSARFAAVLDSIDDALFIKDRDGRYLAVARKFLERTGDAPRVGLRDVDCLTPELAPKVRAADLKVLESGEPLTSEFNAKLSNGRRHTLLMTRTPFHDPVLDDTALCVTGMDISEIKKLQQELEESRDAAQAASRAKSEFLATISHEIRTPLNGVTGMAQILAHTLDSPEQKRMLEMVTESASKLMALFDDILEWSQIETGRITITPRPMRIGEVLMRVLAVHEPKLREKGLRLDLDIAASAERDIEADPDRLGQMLHQLVSNSVKFTEEGRVSISAAIGKDGLTLQVRDTGCGMSETQARYIYDRFSQADMGATRRHGGAGLGMSIVKGLVDAMGGTIALTTSPDLGAAFTITLPVRALDLRFPAKSSISAD